MWSVIQGQGFGNCRNLVTVNFDPCLVYIMHTQYNVEYLGDSCVVINTFIIGALLDLFKFEVPEQDAWLEQAVEPDGGSTSIF